MNFQDAVKIVLELEGGGQLVSHPRDPGGLTKFGISLRANPELGAEGIRNLTEAQAIDIYRWKYWSPLRLSRLSPRLSLSLFDAAVLHGPKATGEILQQALNRLGSDLVVDGVIGEQTVSAARSYSPRRVLAAFTRERLYYCRDLKHYNVFGIGWDQRIILVAISS